MGIDEVNKQNRRNFLKLLSTGSMVFLGCGYLGAVPLSEKNAAIKHKFKMDSKFSFEQVFNFAYGTTVQMLRDFEKEFGRKIFFSLLEKGSDQRAARTGRQMAKNFPKNDLASFAMIMKKPDHFWKHVLTFSIAKDTSAVFEIKVKECLWAKTFRQFNAGDLGYILICRGDFAMARGFNPKMKLLRTKTLMQGHDCCNHCWEMET